MRKRLMILLGSVLVALTMVPVAMADPPTFNPTTDFAPAIEAYANTLFDGLIVLLPVVLAIAAVFTLLGIGVSMVKRWLGRKKATAAAG